MAGSLLYPSKCILCGKPMESDKLICAECIGEKVLIGGKICKYCGVGKEFCNCGQRKHHFIRRIACVYYKPCVRRGISRFKFHRHTMLAEHYGMLLAENIRSKYDDISFDCIVAVPMNRWKRWLRGYNCPELLANVIGERLELPVLTDVLHKRFSFKNQKDVKYFERAGNVLDMFYVRNAENIKDKTVLLIDDVCTSGATLNECAKMLKLYGASKIYAATFATVAKGCS